MILTLQMTIHLPQSSKVIPLLCHSYLIISTKSNKKKLVKKNFPHGRHSWRSICFYIVPRIWTDTKKVQQVHRSPRKPRLTPRNIQRKIFSVIIMVFWYSDLLSSWSHEFGFPWRHNGQESACQCRGHGFEPWSRKIPHATERLSP